MTASKVEVEQWQVVYCACVRRAISSLEARDTIKCIRGRSHEEKNLMAVSPSQRLRIAIVCLFLHNMINSWILSQALAALKFKPPEQSFESWCPSGVCRVMLNSTHRSIAYTLELRYLFCSPATKTTSEECDSWRKRALQLEAELHSTRVAATMDGVGTGPLVLLPCRFNILDRTSRGKASPGFCGR